MTDKTETNLNLRALRAGSDPDVSEPVKLSGRLVGEDADRFRVLVVQGGLGPSKVVQEAVRRFLSDLEKAA